jgi:ArsR family transcriptional regulator
MAMNGYETAASMLRALAHPVRLQIIDLLLAHGSACVCHLEAYLGKSQSYISKQLSTLRAAGLVADRRQGLNVYYSVANDTLPSLMASLRESALVTTGSPDIGPMVWRADVYPVTACSCPVCEPDPLEAVNHAR